MPLPKCFLSAQNVLNVLQVSLHFIKLAPKYSILKNTGFLVSNVFINSMVKKNMPKHVNAKAGHSFKIAPLSEKESQNKD